jgi:hypothetical protein
MTKLEKKDWENIGAGVITFLNLINNEVKTLEDADKRKWDNVLSDIGKALQDLSKDLKRFKE